MADSVEIAGVNKSESTLLVLFIPSVDRQEQSINQEKWEQTALEVLGSILVGRRPFPEAEAFGGMICRTASSFSINRS